MTRFQDFETVICENCECSSIGIDDLKDNNLSHTVQKPHSFLDPMKKIILETTTKGFVSLRLKGKVAFAMSEVECGVSDPHF